MHGRKTKKDPHCDFKQCPIKSDVKLAADSSEENNKEKKEKGSVLLRPFDYFLTTFAHVPFVMDVRGSILKTTSLLFFYHTLQQ